MPVFSVAGENKIKQIESTINSLDSKIEKEALESSFFIKPIDSSKLIFVKSLNGVFDFFDIEFCYAVYSDESAKELVFIEWPYSESGDWFLQNSHYFDSDGKTIAYRQNASFFNSLCSEELHEIFTLMFGDSSNIIYQKYELLNDDFQKIDSTGCIFNYSFERNYHSSIESLKQACFQDFEVDSTSLEWFKQHHNAVIARIRNPKSNVDILTQKLHFLWINRDGANGGEISEYFFEILTNKPETFFLEFWKSNSVFHELVKNLPQLILTSYNDTTLAQLELRKRKLEQALDTFITEGNREGQLVDMASLLLTNVKEQKPRIVE